MQTCEEIVKSLSEFIRNRVSNKLDLQEVLLFGSYAKGTQHKDSDIDIALVSERYSECDYLKEYVKAAMLFHDFSFDIEAHLLCPEDLSDDTLFAREVREHGIVLYSSEKTPGKHRRTVESAQ
jgi:predicted nucleotidyltransferase